MGLQPYDNLDPPRDDRRTGWIIERYVNGELCYWNGMYTDERGLTRKADEGCRFAREEDAAKVLAWLLAGNGRACEHVWSNLEVQSAD